MGCGVSNSRPNQQFTSGVPVEGEFIVREDSGEADDPQGSVTRSAFSMQFSATKPDSSTTQGHRSVSTTQQRDSSSNEPSSEQSMSMSDVVTMDDSKQKEHISNFAIGEHLELNDAFVDTPYKDKMISRPVLDAERWQLALRFYEKAIKFSRKKSEVGKSLVKQGLALLYGLNVSYITYSRAAEKFAVAAEYTPAEGYAWLSFCYAGGLGVERDPVEGLKCANLSLAASDKDDRIPPHPMALTTKSALIVCNPEMRQESADMLSTAYKSLTDLADQNHAWAQSFLAMYMCDGLTIIGRMGYSNSFSSGSYSQISLDGRSYQSHNFSSEMYTGDPDSHNEQVPEMKVQQDTVERDTSRLIEKAAAKGHAYAQYALGFKSHSEGDMKKAMRYYEFAAEQGLPVAAAAVGRVYLQLEGEEGVKKDVNKGVHYLQIAAQQGDEDSGVILKQWQNFALNSATAAV